ncbi:MAG: NAD(P)H-quinone oxidoreductase, partial [Rhodothermales bacterium]|nr:NAD(P)H-quinone oxidoreductase [Rhodothermales bacterium]
MRAVTFETPGEPEVLRIVETNRPEPGPHEVLVRVHATALNRADILQRLGKYAPPPGAPEILGLEASGVVESRGPSAERWEVGDKVFGLLAGGGYAEFVVFSEDLLMPMPDMLSFAEAAAVPEAFLTAFQALILIGQLSDQETALIHAGASGVGTAAIQIAKLFGADVVVTASIAKHGICSSLGASRIVDYRSEDFASAVLEHTAGRGADVILDFIGAPYFAKNIRCSSVDARIVLLALMG